MTTLTHTHLNPSDFTTETVRFFFFWSQCHLSISKRLNWILFFSEQHKKTHRAHTHSFVTWSDRILNIIATICVLYSNQTVEYHSKHNYNAISCSFFFRGLFLCFFFYFYVSNGMARLFENVRNQWLHTMFWICMCLFLKYKGKWKCWKRVLMCCLHCVLCIRQHF